MTEGDGRTTPILALAASALTFGAASTGMAMRLEPFFTWYFVFAWWSYIVAAESLLRLMGGESDLYERPARVAELSVLSVVVWLFFEVLNFRLNNWGYAGVPAELASRWAGYAVSFATVLPGLSVTRRMLDFLGLWHDARCVPWAWTRERRGLLTLAGAVLLALPMAWPRYFFPLVWGGVVLLLEPWLHARGGRSLLRDLALGRPRNVYLLLSAGLVCGGLWECWNYWAGAKWFYTVPFVGQVKLFEMPVLGFLGFPPFALECYAAASAYELVRDRIRSPVAWGVIALCAIVFAGVAMAGIDRFTVAAFG